MDLHAQGARPQADGYLAGPRQAWFAFAMTIALMMVDYIDRQVIVSLFPHLKQDWGLSDKQLGALVSAVSVTVALGAIPVALVADRFSRVKSIVVMATVWSLASISCMFTRNYSQLLAARALVGLGEAGYGSVGAALIASHFPARMRGALMAAFFACASVGSVLGVMLGGLIAARWGWQAAFGIVGVPGLVLALLYWKVRDYRTVALNPRLERATSSTRGAAGAIVRRLMRCRTLLWLCLAAPAQLILVSAVWAWLPSYLNRLHGLAPDQAAVRASLVVLCGALGSVAWGALADRAGRTRPRAKLHLTAFVCVASSAVLAMAFGAQHLGVVLTKPMQFALFAVGGFLMTCSVGVVAAAVIDVVHPGIRATGASVMSLFQNLLGLAAGPFIAGLLSDAWSLEHALTVMPVFGLLAAAGFMAASRNYEADLQLASQTDAIGEHAAGTGEAQGMPA
ncbi:MFS transporter [Variovorax dokdonensis]|uniref:MFS transporter n=1 Tax=Variovorax dokdonensis TaxID=344883 RepID=A0ABT7N9B6_9BURK|nr:MFS transporter [Variovorax dokdonensis]MDM0044528.1 MFS transporter [Variovorax dokdonensis]